MPVESRPRFFGGMSMIMREQKKNLEDLVQITVFSSLGCIVTTCAQSGRLTDSHLIFLLENWHCIQIMQFHPLKKKKKKKARRIVIQLEEQNTHPYFKQIKNIHRCGLKRCCLAICDPTLLSNQVKGQTPRVLLVADVL